MGQRFAKHAGASSRRVAVDERFTKPCGLYQHRNIDGGKLKSLIVSGKLSPCFPGVEEPKPGDALEECPICFLVRPVARVAEAREPPVCVVGVANRTAPCGRCAGSTTRR